MTEAVEYHIPSNNKNKKSETWGKNKTQTTTMTRSNLGMIGSGSFELLTNILLSKASADLTFTHVQVSLFPGGDDHSKLDHLNIYVPHTHRRSTP